MFLEELLLQRRVESHQILKILFLNHFFNGHLYVRNHLVPLHPPEGEVHLPRRHLLIRTVA